MAIKIPKGNTISLEKSNGSKLMQFCVGCKWGKVMKPAYWGLSSQEVDVDIDLSCLMFDFDGKPIDHIYSPLYQFRSNPRSRNLGLPDGKLMSRDGALRHTGDDLEGGGEIDNEIITVDLTRVSSNVASIVFFLNVYNNEEYKGDFSGVPYCYIRMFEGQPQYAPRQVFAQYDVSVKTDCVGMRGLVLGKLFRQRYGDWKFKAIGDANADPSIVNTIARVLNSYSN